MALTREVIVANSALAGLTDEQIRTITTLSVNDENSVIAQKIGEIYGNLDADILSVSGVAKNGTEKTYDYAKRVLGDFKSKLEGLSTLQKDFENISKEKTKLEKSIAEGSANSEIAQQLRQAKADLSSVQSQFNELKAERDKSEKSHKDEIFGIRIDSSLKTAVAGLKFKDGLPESATEVLITQAMQKIKSMNPEIIDNGKGDSTLVFKDDSGAIMRNPNNQLNPYTPKDLLVRELESMGILDKGRQAAGGGTIPPNNSNKNHVNSVIEVSGMKSRTEAYDAIAQTLMSRGMTVGSKEFDVAMSQAWKDNNIAELPEK